MEIIKGTNKKSLDNNWRNFDVYNIPANIFESGKYLFQVEILGKWKGISGMEYRIRNIVMGNDTRPYRYKPVVGTEEIYKKDKNLVNIGNIRTTKNEGFWLNLNDDTKELFEHLLQGDYSLLLDIGE